MGKTLSRIKELTQSLTDIDNQDLEQTKLLMEEMQIPSAVIDKNLNIVFASKKWVDLVDLVDNTELIGEPLKPLDKFNKLIAGIKESISTSLKTSGIGLNYQDTSLKWEIIPCISNPHPDKVIVTVKRTKNVGKKW